MATRTATKSPARKAAASPAQKRSPASAPKRKSTSTPNGSHSPKRGAQYLPKKVDGYIASAGAFAQPILHHIRELVHKALPDVEEDIKWSMPFFIYRGLMVGNMAAFKQHCSFGLWGKEATADLRADGLYDRKAMGVLGKLTSLKDLPSDREFIKYVRAAAAEIDIGARTTNYSRSKPSAPKPPPESPASLAAALKKNKAAATHFAAMPPGCKREYCEWIAEAKRDETRDKRVATAIEWIAEGKRRNWKYENC
jgi:uncharacterized protein YdeI (YjbR/CyaY-like superfamily)